MARDAARNTAEHGCAPRFVVSDVDGTLVDDRDRISPAMVKVVEEMNRQGVTFTLATGRPARWLIPVIAQLPVQPVCVCANGAVTYDSATDTIVKTRHLEPEVLAQLVDTIAESRPELGFAVERAGTSAFDRDRAVFAVTKNYNHAWDSDEHTFEDPRELTGLPAVKLLVRHPHWKSSELYKEINPLIDPAVAHATYSWEGGLVEISAPGVSKRLALQELAEELGVPAQDVVAFGDMPNDIEMLSWAGVGVAMGNASDKVTDMADEITASNNNDGVARFLERWF